MRVDPRQWMCCFFCAGLAGWLALTPAAAQEDFPEDFEQSGALTLQAGPQGEAEVQIWFQGVDDPKVLTARLRAALPCELEPQAQTAQRFVRLAGNCPGLLHREGSLVRGRLDLGPVLQAAGLKDPWYFNAIVHLPSSVFSRCGDWERSPFLYGGAMCTASFYPSAAKSPAGEIVYGFRPADLAWRLGLMGVLAVVPIPLLLRQRRRVLATAGEARLKAWFGYWRAYRSIHQGGWLLWFAVLYALRLDDWLNFLVDSSLARQVLLLALLTVPPALVFLFGHHLSQPVLAHVQELARSRREVLQEALGYLLFGLAPIALNLVGLEARDAGMAAMILWFVLALAAAVLGRWIYLGGSQMYPHALTIGELRDRIFEMSRRVRVKLHQVYILPASRMRMANAFATAGNNVLLTDYLLSHLTRREVEAVVAHEVAHLRYRHVAIVPFVMVGLVFLALTGSAFLRFGTMFWGVLAPATHLVESIDFLPLLLLAGLLPLRWLLRRFERSADAYAAMLTGDPEGLISALGKLARLSLLPLSWTWWEDRVSTHPSMIRRGEALALRFGLSFDRMERLLKGEASLDDGRYELPASTLSPDRVFTTQFKSRASPANLFVLLGITTGTGALASWWVHRADESWPWYGLALVGGWVALQLAVNVLGPLGYEGLARRLALRYEQEGISPAALGGIFVGFAPDDSPRVYEGHTVWDVGFLVLGRDGLVYLGDQTRFRLGHGQVAAVRLGAGMPTWWRVESVYVDWRSAEGWVRTFHVHGRGRTLWRIRRSTQQLAARLSAWLRAPESSPELPAALSKLPPPLVGEVTGLFPREALRPRNLLTVCWLIFIVSVLLAVLLEDRRGVYTAPMIALALYFAQFVPYLFAGSLRKARQPGPALAERGEA